MSFIKKPFCTVFLTGLFTLLINNRSHAQTIDSSTYKITCIKTTDEIKIDGIDQELTWQNQNSIATNFYQNFPYDTSFAKSKTEVKIASDGQNLYVFAKCFDSDTIPYVVQSLKRDWSYPRSDAFVVSIEPFLDYTNGFSFGVNPFGAQREGLIENGGTFGVSTAWDNKWYAETKQHDSFWTVEMQIPFKSIRFNEKAPYWRINFARNNLKINENSTWFPVPRILNIAVLSHMGIANFENKPLKNGLNAAIIPYVTTSAYKDYNRNTPTQITPNAGFDAKVVLTSSLNLDLTVNPDFSQVDVDEQQINLTRFNLFFPERRQFFIENSDLFASFGFRQIRPFFSRRIGLNGGNIVPIIAGARLSGKLGTKWRIGALNIQTAEQMESLNPATNYSVFAFQKTIFGSSNFAGIIVNKLRQKIDTLGAHNNTVLGLDYNLQSKDNQWRGKVFYHQSLENGKLLPQSETHASWFMRNTINWFMMWNHEFVGKNYNAEVGFTPRIFVRNDALNTTIRQSYWRLEPEIKRRFYPNSNTINQYSIGWYNSTYMDTSFTINDMVNSVFSELVFQNSANASLSYRFYNTYLYFPVEVTGKSGNLAAGRYLYNDVNLRYESNTRKIFNYEIRTAYGSFYTGTKLSLNTTLNLRIQPKAILAFSYRREDIKLPSPNKNAVLTLIGPRIEYSFTKKLFTTLFVQYNTQAENVNINARLQYRFAPMSDLFIVFSENYLPNQIQAFGSTNFPYLNVRNRGITFKLSYWLNS